LRRYSSIFVGINEFPISTTLPHVASPLVTQTLEIDYYAKSHHGGVRHTRVPAYIPVILKHRLAHEVRLVPTVAAGINVIPDVAVPIQLSG
jgi:hypothetical protein